jgi:hypothetical protein
MWHTTDNNKLSNIIKLQQNSIKTSISISEIIYFWNLINTLEWIYIIRSYVIYYLKYLKSQFLSIKIWWRDQIKLSNFKIWDQFCEWVKIGTTNNYQRWISLSSGILSSLNYPWVLCIKKIQSEEKPILCVPQVL